MAHVIKVECFPCFGSNRGRRNVLWEMEPSNRLTCICIKKAADGLAVPSQVFFVSQLLISAFCFFWITRSCLLRSWVDFLNLTVILKHHCKIKPGVVWLWVLSSLLLVGGGRISRSIGDGQPHWGRTVSLPCHWCRETRQGWSTELHKSIWRLFGKVSMDCTSGLEMTSGAL